jgi:hypothetical protein
MKNEKDVKRRVKAILDKHDWFYFMPPANAYGRSGISDFIALKNGVMLAIETKFGSNKPTAMQKGFLGSVNAESAFGFVVNDQNIDWLQAFLEDFGAQTELVASEGKMANEAGAQLINAIRALQALI